jgi:4-hydroxythreonine-4-phosphate dehydrogenase
VQTVLAASDAAAVFGRGHTGAGQPLPAPVAAGRPEPANAGSVADWIEQAVNLAMSGEASGVVTAPIAKAPLYAAGFRFPGHTEFIAELTADAPFAGTRGPVMMLTAKDLRACLVTIHSPLAEVPELVTVERVCRTARVVHEALKRDFGIVAPRLALAALNPHAGEGGAIGPGRDRGLPRRSRPCAPRASRSPAPCPPTPCSTTTRARPMTPSCACITIRP